MSACGCEQIGNPYDETPGKICPGCGRLNPLTAPSLSNEALCKGAWSLGTACGKCSRCLSSAPAEIKRLNAVLAEVNNDLGMFRRAWKRELGEFIAPKNHLIDALVLGTATLRENYLALRDFEKRKNEAACEAVRAECEASWHIAALDNNQRIRGFKR